MGKALGMSVIAEGVETAEQLAVLRSLGCDQVQGYLIAKPLPADDFLAFMQARSS
jgi:EAL domain-containing protein (putative c-di-GMP-specific phosphodiesterase class I)